MIAWERLPTLRHEATIGLALGVKVLKLMQGFGGLFFCFYFPFGLSNKVSPKESYPREEGSPLPSVPHFASFPFPIPFLAWLALLCALRETRVVA